MTDTANPRSSFDRGLAPAGPHPLEPLSAEEITRAVAVLRAERELADTVRFSTVELHEPSKANVLDWPLAGPVEREAFIIVMDRADGAVHEAVVSLDAGTVTEWRHIPGVQPRIMEEEFVECEEMLKGHPEYLAALSKRGITNPDLLMIDPWSCGASEGTATRFCRALTWVRNEEGDNGYARPVEGLIAFVDLHNMEVVRIEDHGITPLPTESGNYAPRYVGDLRNDLRPIEITQPEGPSFNVDGHEIRWQKWRLRIGFTAREGLVIHTAAYEDGDRLRPVLYRASFSEMVVPYGEVAPTHVWKNAFDIGEYGIGVLANSLELGCDCLGEIHYFDAVLSDAAGEPKVLRNAICLHEEDFSLMWKHIDWRTGETEVRRSRRLVVSFVATVGNYEYGYYWSFFQDGSIESEVKLTGIVSTGAAAPGEPTPHATRIAPGLTAPNHQHFFNVRLDMMVDGVRNSVVEVDTEAVPMGPDNPAGNAFRAVETVLAREGESGRMVDPLRGRYWKVINPSVHNGVNAPVGYKLEPGENVASFVHPESSIAARAGFMTGHVWVTPYDPTQRFAAGDYPNQHPGGDGLPAWIKADRPTEDTDVVLWYSMGHHHIPRTEDWPVMPVHRIGFSLNPNGFFDRNPALDVPPPATHCRHS
ncbi:MAG: primary-amine oxidase [Actinomycetota bacterium]|nr:primary-amine oxidase [Actinomycetota bacterium]